MNIYNENYYLDFYSSELEKGKLLLKTLIQNNHNLFNKFILIKKEIEEILETATIKTIEDLTKSVELNIPKLNYIEELIHFNDVVIEPELLESFNSLKCYVYDNTSIESIDNTHNQIQEIIKQNYYLKNLKSTTLEKEIQINKKIESENLLKAKQTELEKEKSIENQKQIELDKLKSIENVELAKKEKEISDNKLKEYSLKKIESENLLKVKQIELEKEKSIENQKQIELDKLKSFENAGKIKNECVKIASIYENLKLNYQLELKKNEEFELKIKELQNEKDKLIEKMKFDEIFYKQYIKDFRDCQNKNSDYESIIFGDDININYNYDLSTVKTILRTRFFVILTFKSKIEVKKRDLIKEIKEKQIKNK